MAGTAKVKDTRSYRKVVADLKEELAKEKPKPVKTAKTTPVKEEAEDGK
jgi:hypothetical protein